MEKKVFTDENVKITKENVQRLGELIAVRALKTVAVHSDNRMVYLYKGLLRDVYHSYKDVNDTYSDGYDIAQTAICFLCGFIGKTLGDAYKINKYGKIVTIKRACYTEVNKHIYRLSKPIYNTISYDNPDTKDPSEEFDGNETKDGSAVEDLISKMNLTEGLKETLNCYMGGMTFVEIAKFLSVNLSTVWHRRIQLQQIYNNKIACFKR